MVHAGTGTSGFDASTVAWSDINQVMLMGGFNGAGCNTGDGDVADTKVCHARLWPSGAAAINWSRNNNGVTLSTATSTVMVVEWGSEWNVQSVRVQGSNGGDGVNTAGEYNTAAIAPVTRAQTWVWGTGHTDDNGLGDASEGVVVTLGNGVAQNGTEATVAVATEYGGTAVDFQVWALQHPDLAVDQVFKADGDTGSLTVDVAVASATANRMALSYNTQNGTGTAYPRPFFSARYLADDTVRLERRRSGQGFAAVGPGHRLRRHRRSGRRRSSSEPDRPRRRGHDRTGRDPDGDLSGGRERPPGALHHRDHQHRHSQHRPGRPLRRLGDRSRGAALGDRGAQQRRIRGGR